MVSVVLRGEAVGFAATVMFTMPVPDPLVVLNVTQDTGLWADQAQPEPAVTHALAVELPPPNVTEVGDTV